MARSPRNKTLNVPPEQAGLYLGRCLTPTAALKAEEVLDKTILGNIFAVADFLPRAFADLLVADPPYNLNKTFHGARFGKMDDGAYAAYTSAWLDKILPLLKPTASVYVCCDWRSGMVIGSVLASRLRLRNRITWQREKGRGAKANWKNGMEDIWFATVSDEYTFNLEAVKQRRRVLAPYRQNGRPKGWVTTPNGNYRDTCPSNFWDDLSVPYWSMPENTPHPTQKPEKLLAKLILAGSSPGQVVLDPFLGSGTTSAVAAKLGRRFVGVEQNPTYCVWAEKRIELARANTRIQGYEDGVFWERNSRPPAP